MKKLLFITLTTFTLADTHTCVYMLDNIIREVEREDYSLAMTYAEASLKVCDDDRAVKAVNRFIKRIEDE